MTKLTKHHGLGNDFLVALEAEVAHLGVGHQVDEGLQHPDAGTQHGDRHHPRVQSLHHRRLQRRLDCLVARG